MTYTTHFLALCLLVVPALACGAEPSPTVYKCAVNGKTVYSDQPCLGAVEVDVTPTRGMNKSTGVERIGADVNRERNRELIADMVKPLTGTSRAEFEVLRRRVNLPSKTQEECRKLDASIARLKIDESKTKGPQLAEIQRQLLTERTRLKSLSC